MSKSEFLAENVLGVHINFPVILPSAVNLLLWFLTLRKSSFKLKILTSPWITESEDQTRVQFAFTIFLFSSSDDRMSSYSDDESSLIYMNMVRSSRC